MHFIKNLVGTVALRRPHVGVTIEVTSYRSSTTIKVQPSKLHVVKPSTELVPLPAGFEVLGSDGKACKPFGRFYVTVETFNPYHILLDIHDSAAVW